MSEMIVRFHHDERGITRSWDVVGKLIRCKDCVHNDGCNPISDGRYWCLIHDSFMYYCSDGELRGDSDE